MIQVDEIYIDKITENIYNSLKGYNMLEIDLPQDFPENELRQLIDYFNTFVREFNTTQDFIYSISRGELDYIPPKGKMKILQSFKSLQASLKHLTWKTQQISNGDFDQKVDFMGDFSQAFNKMTQQLKEAFEEIERKNAELKYKNDRITESIQYAKKIQNAILPSKKYLDEKLINYFILYFPKDIVSGDFYWCTQIDDDIILTVADCTGHGVPGAFITVMGNTLLNKIVNQEKVRDTDIILKRLNNEVKGILKQKDDDFNILTDQSEGMDLCMVKLSKNKLFFSGAKRPLYIVNENRKDKILRIKGDRFCIGGRQKKEAVFSCEQLELLPGDNILLTTDGFVDQCNNDGVKYGTPRFEELIVRISSLSVEKQYCEVLEELKEHMGEEQQRDDITILNFKYEGE